MSTTFNINQSGNLDYDPCYILKSEVQSSEPGKYMTSSFKSCECEIPSAQKIALEQPGVNFREGFGWTSCNGCDIDRDSSYRNGKRITNLNCVNQLSERPYLTVPYMGRGKGNPRLEPSLIQGESTLAKKSCNTGGKDMTQYHLTPLLSSVERIQAPDSVIPENHGMSRGGVGTRQLVRNINYLKKCGYAKQDNKWVKKSA